MTSSPSQPFYFLGLRFWNNKTDALLQEIDRDGGMLAVPSAPSLAQASEDELLKKAYQTSDWSVMDGGYVALIVRMLGRNIPRISGLQLIQKLTDSGSACPFPVKERKILWAIPSEQEGARIRTFLERQGFDAAKQTYYLAPFYKSDADFNDQTLNELVGSVRPDWIILCLGGGRQEKLGYYLRRATAGFDRKPVILCTGAAIAFFTGGQASIPTWADRLYLGWFFRVMQDPKAFIPRYLVATWKFPLAMWRQRGTWFKVPPAGNA